LSLDDEAGQAQLRRGVYVAALPGRWLPGPAWRRYEMAPAGTGPAVRLCRRGTTEAPIAPDFGYLMLVVATRQRSAPGAASDTRA